MSSLVLQWLSPALIGIGALLYVYNNEQNKNQLIRESFSVMAMAAVIVLAKFRIYFPYSCLAAMAVLVFGLIVRRNLMGFNFFLLGGVLNFLAIFANGGDLPVASVIKEKDGVIYQIFRKETIFPFLSDWVHIGDAFFSIGDILLMIGGMVFCIVQANIRMVQVQK